MDDKGDMRLRAIAQLALAVEAGDDVEQAVQAAYMADVEPSEIAELSGLPLRRGAGDPGATGDLRACTGVTVRNGQTSGR